MIKSTDISSLQRDDDRRDPQKKGESPGVVAKIFDGR